MLCAPHGSSAGASPCTRRIHTVTAPGVIHCPAWAYIQKPQLPALAGWRLRSSVQASAIAGGRWLDFETAQLALGVANVEPPVGQRGGSPAEAAQHLGARQRFESFRGRLPQQQFALLGEDDLLVPGQDQRTERWVFRRPF